MAWLNLAPTAMAQPAVANAGLKAATVEPGSGPVSRAPSSRALPALTLPSSVVQDLRVEDQYAAATARLHWDAKKGESLSLLSSPAVLTQLVLPKGLKLLEEGAGAKRSRQLLAEESGSFDIEVRYQLEVTRKGDESGIALPTPYGLINELTLTLLNLDVDVRAPDAVDTQHQTSGSNTVARLVLAPTAESWIAWRPRTRNVKREKPVFYAELQQLSVPTAGAIDGVCVVGPGRTERVALACA
jgi:hypothetical protein